MKNKLYFKNMKYLILVAFLFVCAGLYVSGQDTTGITIHFDQVRYQSRTKVIRLLCPMQNRFCAD